MRLLNGIGGLLKGEKQYNHMLVWILHAAACIAGRLPPDQETDWFKTWASQRRRNSTVHSVLFF